MQDDKGKGIEAREAHTIHSVSHNDSGQELGSGAKGFPENVNLKDMSEVSSWRDSGRQFQALGSARLKGWWHLKVQETFGQLQVELEEGQG